MVVKNFIPTQMDWEFIAEWYSIHQISIVFLNKNLAVYSNVMETYMHTHWLEMTL